MMSRLLAITSWLAVGHAAVFGVFWLFLKVPESNIAMLATSALLVLVLAALTGWIEAAALLAWRRGATVPGSLKRAVVVVPAVLAGLAVFALLSTVATRGHAWWLGHTGEIDAWLMARFGWARTLPLHATVDWIVVWLRGVLGLSVASTLAAWLVVAGPSSLKGIGWLRTAVGLRQLAVLTLLAAILIYLPWRATAWRPTWFSPDWREVAFAVARLGALYLIAHVGWALILRRAASSVPIVPGPIVPSPIEADPS